MNKTRKIATAILLMLACLSALLFCSCGDQGTAVINGVKNLNVSAEITEYDFLKGVSGSLNGESAEVKVDSSAVKFGTVGTYEVYYTLGNLKQIATVKIYGDIKVASSDAELSFEQAVNGATEKITAVDSFGVQLTPEVIDYGVPAKYKYEYGKSYEVTYRVSDKAGNTEDFKRNIKITGKPMDFGNVATDLVDTACDLDIKGAELICITDSEGNEYTDASINEGRLTALGQVAGDLGVGVHEITVYTTKGYGDIKLTVTDKEKLDFAFNYGDVKTGIDGYIYSVGEKVNFPKIVNGEGSYQKYDVSYSLEKDGQPIDINTFSTEETGKYIYKCTFKRDNNVTETVESAFYVVLEEEKNNNIFNTDTNQFLSSFDPFYSNGATLDFVRDVYDKEGTSYNALEYYIPVTGIPLTHSLKFNNNAILEALKTGSRTLKMKVLFDEEYAEYTDGVYICLFIGYDNGALWKISNSQYNGVATNGKKWVELSFELSQWVCPYPNYPDYFSVDAMGNMKLNYDHISLYFNTHEGAMNSGIARKDLKVYIADISLGETNKNITPKSYYDFENNNSITVKADAITVNNNGEETRYDSFNYSEYGLLKFMNAGSQDILGQPVFAKTKGDTLIVGDRTYYGLTYETGNIYKIEEEISFARYGDHLKEYVSEINYDLYKTDDTKVEFDKTSFVKKFTEPGSYNLRLTLSAAEHNYVFDNYFYVSDGTDFFNKYVTAALLKYDKVNTVNGEKKDCYSLMLPNNPDAHKPLTISAEYVNEMLDEGKTEVSVYICSPEGDNPAIYTQIFRMKNGTITQSSGNPAVPWELGVDYLATYTIPYGTFRAFKFKIDETYRNGTVGFSFTRNVIIGDIVFSKPA